MPKHYSDGENEKFIFARTLSIDLIGIHVGRWPLPFVVRKQIDYIQARTRACRYTDLPAGKHVDTRVLASNLFCQDGTFSKFKFIICI